MNATLASGTVLQTGGTTTRASDAAVLNETLELAAERCEDLTPLVYQRFFALRPEAAVFFNVPDPTMPPLGCGQMLFEIISLLTDAAAGKPHVVPYMHQIVSDHMNFKVTGEALYRDFLAALMDVLADLLGSHWTDRHSQAWARQVDVLLVGLR